MLRRRARTAAKEILQISGWDVVRRSWVKHSAGQRIRLLRHHAVDLVLDVGANAGQYARELRRSGYAGEIVSFEPLGKPFATLQRAAARDPKWTAVKTALGSEAGVVTMNIAGNSISSSILEMLPTHEDASPASRTIGNEEVQVTTLDSVFDDYVRSENRVFLKIDVQGYEDRVLLGAPESLRRIVGLELELSLVPLYEGSPVFDDMLHRLWGLGFETMSIRPGMADAASGRLLQFDAILFRCSRDEPSAVTHS